MKQQKRNAPMLAEQYRRIQILTNTQSIGYLPVLYKGFKRTVINAYDSTWNILKIVEEFVTPADF